jgi:transcriptional regulator with XRE-family HTH domain
MGRRPTLASIISGLRTKNRWTLREMSNRTGIPLSTLAKVERGELTLTYDKLQQASERLGMPLSEFLKGNAAERPTTGRRALGVIENALNIATGKYDYYYLCTELRRKRMVPLLADVRARTVEEFGEMHRHTGEEFTFVLSGAVKVVTEFYDTSVLREGQSIYIDASMAHAYLLADGCDEARILCVMASGDEDLMEKLALDLEQPLVRRSSSAI